jgi:hypothetical protein
MNDEVLRKQYQFDDTDLFDNRNGFITPGQRLRLGHQRSIIHRWARLLGFILVIGDLLGMVLLWQNHLIEMDILSILGNWPVFIPLLIGVVAIWAGFSKEEQISLSKVEGPLEVVKVKEKYIDGSTDTHFELHCGKEKFEATPAMEGMESNGQVYVIYYFKDVANGNTLFSAEQVGNAPTV